MNVCKYCHKETLNQEFCNRSCSAFYHNNLRKQKIILTNKCKKCEALIKDNRIYCNECYEIIRFGMKDYTIEECIKLKGKSNTTTLIRYRARLYAIKILKFTKCEHCGYSKHIEICHKNAISNFSKECLISEVNHKDNLIGLCPNCHWEFDHPNQEFVKLNKNEKTKFCGDCGKLICDSSIKCRDCDLLNRKSKIDWPPLDDLLKMIDENNYSKVGRILGVSANAIKKHIKKYQQ